MSSDHTIKAPAPAGQMTIGDVAEVLGDESPDPTEAILAIVTLTPAIVSMCVKLADQLKKHAKKSGSVSGSFLLGAILTDLATMISSGSNAAERAVLVAAEVHLIDRGRFRRLLEMTKNIHDRACQCPRHAAERKAKP